MALEGNTDFLKPPGPKFLYGWLIFLIVGNMGWRIYDLWRDWQRHRFVWEHLILLLVSLWLVISLW